MAVVWVILPYISLHWALPQAVEISYDCIKFSPLWKLRVRTRFITQLQLLKYCCNRKSISRFAVGSRGRVHLMGFRILFCDCQSSSCSLFRLFAWRITTNLLNFFYDIGGLLWAQARIRQSYCLKTFSPISQRSRTGRKIHAKVCASWTG